MHIINSRSDRAPAKMSGKGVFSLISSVPSSHRTCSRPAVVAAFAAAVAFWGGAFACLTSPLWLALASHPAGLRFTALLLVAGAALLVAAPRAVQLMLMTGGQSPRLTLDPAADRQRIRQLELTRGQMIENSAAKLGHIERDIHDGAQARLVTMTMRLCLLRERLASATGPDADAARELTEMVHRDATQAMAELRDLGRGIRPPALDSGLGPAIDSLAAHGPVPIDLRVSLTDRPSAGIETIAYYCVAELLADISEHSRASSARIEITQRDRSLYLQIAHDGAGRATAEQRSGLASAAGYVRSVDGTLSVHGPAGGPTLVTAMLPFQV
jgi:signal transduction histidine kinase